MKKCLIFYWFIFIIFLWKMCQILQDLMSQFVVFEWLFMWLQIWLKINQTVSTPHLLAYFGAFECIIESSSAVVLLIFTLSFSELSKIFSSMLTWKLRWKVYSRHNNLNLRSTYCLVQELSTVSQSLHQHIRRSRISTFNPTCTSNRKLLSTTGKDIQYPRCSLGSDP